VRFDGAAYSTAPDGLTDVAWAMGATVVAVVVSCGRVVVGTLIGVAGALTSAWAAPGAKASSPTRTTEPTRAAGTATRARSTLRIRGPIYLSRNRQA